MENWQGYLDKFNAYGWFLLIIVLERLFPTRRIPLLNRGWVFDLLHTYEPFVRAFLIGAAAAALIPYAAHVPGHGWLSGEAIWLNLVALMLISEVTFYFVHRLTHMSPTLWEFHRVHHSSTTYYSFMTSRFHILDLVLFALPYVVIAAYLGARPEALMAYSVFQGFMDRYGHSNVRGPRFNWYFLGNPHFHAWHHSNDPAAHDKNFSRDFAFMDYIFGTAYYPKDKLAEDFGDPTFPVNYVTQQVLPFWNVGRRLARRFIPAREAEVSAKEQTGA